MNIDDLRDQLEELAGPVPSATATARAAVGTRVQRGRRRRSLIAGGTSALAVALVVAIVAIGLNGSGGPVKVGTTTPSTTTAPPVPRCALGVSTVPGAQVPNAVSAWAHGFPVVGGDELWTTRRAITVGPLHDGAVYRMKISWFTTPFGLPAITARRLDAVEPPATGDANEAIDQRGRWVASTIELPSAGCWEITARYQNSTIVFRRLVGDPPRPLAIGTIAGLLEEVGFRSLPIRGTIKIDGTTTAVNDFGVSVKTDENARFRVDVPAGIHDVTATSPQFQGGRFPCTAGRVIVRPGQTVHVDVNCPIR
jgi:hypothetical protein